MEASSQIHDHQVRDQQISNDEKATKPCAYGLYIFPPYLHLHAEPFGQTAVQTADVL
jgi:hypothetical protein